MNINALINPTSCGKYTWSILLKQHPQILGNYDGFNYLGVGILVSILLLFILMVKFRTYKNVIEKIRNNIPLLIICTLLYLFAISNVVTFNDKVLFEIPLPEFILKLCAIFRASARLFYPVYYLIFFYVIGTLWEYKELIKRKNTYILLTFIVLIQILDIGKCINQKHMLMEEKVNYVSPIIYDSTLKQIANNSNNVLIDQYKQNYRNIAVWAYKNGLNTYFTIANSGNYSETYNLGKKIVAEIKKTGDIGDNVIVTTNSNVAKLYEKFDNIQYYEKDKVYFILGK